MGNSNTRFTQLEAVEVKNDLYKLYNAKRIEGGKPVSVFVYDMDGKIELKKVQHHINVFQSSLTLDGQKIASSFSFEICR